MCERDTSVVVDIAGEPRGIDACLAPLVRALNDAGIRTVASCCGHGIRPGNIALADGRELVIAPDFDTSRLVERAFPPLATTDPPQRKVEARTDHPRECLMCGGQRCEHTTRWAADPPQEADSDG